MIDTVILTIARTDFQGLVGAHIPQWELHSKSGNYQKLVKNQNSFQKKDDIYRPRIRGIVRGRTKFMQIEFSVPKLIYGNNLEEVSEKEFEKVIEILRERLIDFGIVVSKKVLREATVSSFHPSKNVLLKDGFTSSSVIKELQKINLTKKLDLNKDSFRNEGQSLQCYANSHSLVIYDKIQDLKKPKKRAIDKDQTVQQLSLFESVTKPKGMNEVLRIEVRLSKKVKMNQVLKSLGFSTGPTFEDIFKKEVCQKIVEHYWKTIIENENVFLFSASNSPKSLLKALLSQKKPPKAKQAIYLVGLAGLCKDDKGIRDLRNILNPAISSRGWYRFANDLKSLNYIEAKNSQSWVTQIENSIKTFKSIKVRDGPNGSEIKSIIK